MRNSDIRGLYYITHIDNISSILARGILSHEKIKAEYTPYTSIYDNSIVENRRGIFTLSGRSLWHYANLFFQPRNPMLYRLINTIGRRNLAVFSIANTVLQEQGIFITDGIAANRLTSIHPQPKGLKILQAQQEIIQSDSWISWNHCNELRRKLMAECLVPNQVNPEHIQRFIVADPVVADLLQTRLSPSNIRKLVVADDERSNIFTPLFDHRIDLC